MATLNDPAASRAERIKAAKALADSRDPQAIDTLVKQLAIMDEGIVAAVESALRALNAVPVLEQRLADSGASEEHKVLACTGLRALKEKSSIPPLVSALKDHSARVRKEAALALGVIAPAEAGFMSTAGTADRPGVSPFPLGRPSAYELSIGGMIGLKLAIDFGERFQSMLLADTPDLMPLSGSYPPPPQRLSSAERISDIARSLAGDEAALRDDDRRPRQCGRRDAVEHFCQARGNPLTVRAPRRWG